MGQYESFSRQATSTRSSITQAPEPKHARIADERQKSESACTVWFAASVVKLPQQESKEAPYGLENELERSDKCVNQHIAECTGAS